MKIIILIKQVYEKKKKKKDKNIIRLKVAKIKCYWIRNFE